MPSGRPRIGVVGSANVDLVVRASRLPAPGETVVGGDVVRLPGGKGANQSAAAARLGADVTLLASVGDDPSGRWLVEGLGALGVDVSRVQTSARPTGTAFITVDDEAENQIVVAPGANRDLELGDQDVADFDVVIAQMEVGYDVVARAARRARRFLLNTAPVAGVDGELLSRCAVVIANEVEASALDLSLIAHCVVTLGWRGAVHLNHGREVARAIPPDVDVVDTVGAGDVFCAAYALADAEGAAPEEALAFAVTAGALATRAAGAQGSLPTREEVESWL